MLPIATDAAFFPDGRHIIVRNYSEAAVYSWPELEEVGRFGLPDQQQGEGIAVDPLDGTIYASSEGLHAPVLRISLPPAVRSAMTAAGRQPDSRAERHSQRHPGAREPGRDRAARGAAGRPVSLGVGAGRPPRPRHRHRARPRPPPTVGPSRSEVACGLAETSAVPPAGEVDHPSGSLGWGAWSDSGAAAPTGRGGPVAARARVSSTSTPTAGACRADDAQRVKDLVIPPAWQDVWVCPWPNGHLQAVGTDDAGRRQYLYHPDWRTRRDGEKFQKMLTFGKALSKAREQVLVDLGAEGMTRGARVRGRRTAARPRVLPDRQRRLRRGEPELRADHAGAAARPAGGQDAGLRLRRQVRDRAP